MTPGLLSSAQLAKRWQCSVTTVARICDLSCELPASRLGRMRFYTPQQADAMWAAHHGQAAPVAVASSRLPALNELVPTLDDREGRVREENARLRHALAYYALHAPVNAENYHRLFHPSN